MSLLDPLRKTLWVNICDVSSTCATVEFDPPQKIIKRDIERFEVFFFLISILNYLGYIVGYRFNTELSRVEESRWAF